MKLPRPHFGPGTVVSLVAAIGVGGYAYLNQPQGEDLSVLRQRASAQKPLPPLQKREPANAFSLALTPEQERSVKQIDQAWQKERTALIRAMEGATAPAEKGGRTLAQLKGGLQGYSALSREFDQTRQRYWEQTLNVLTPAQRLEVAK